MITSVRHLSMKFGDYRALDDVNLDIGEGEFVAVLGPSGCGKTTLLRILLGLTKPDAGTLAPQGVKLSCAFQEERLIQGLSAVGNVLLACPCSCEQA